MSKPLRTPEQKELAHYIMTLAQEKRRLRAKLAAVERDERQAIQAAAAHGVPQTYIAQTTGLTKGRVSQIVKETKGRYLPGNILEDQKKTWNWDVPRFRKSFTEELPALAEVGSDGENSSPRSAGMGTAARLFPPVA